MSVNYSTGLGYGYCITPQMLEELYNRGGEDLFDEFKESRWAYPVNGWIPDSTFYFFGIPQGFIEPGYMAPIPARHTYVKKEFEQMVEEFKYYFPNLMDYSCQDLIIYYID